MKNKKLILGLSTLLAVSGLAMSCGKRDNKTPEEKVEEVLGSLIYDGLDACTTDITLIYEIPDVKGVEITYAASNAKDSLEASNWLKISDDKKKALVTRPAKGTTEKGYELAFLHANVKCENVEDKTVFPVKIMESGDTKTIGEVLQITSENKDNPVVTKGYVVAVGDGCCFIADKTGSILVYSSDAVKDVAVGDSVQVEGSLSFYQGVPQFAYSAAVKVSLTKLEENIDFTPSLKYARRNRAQDVLFAVEFQRMARIGTALKTRNRLITGSQHIDNLAFALIAPLQAEYDVNFIHDLFEKFNRKKTILPSKVLIFR